jgi:copper homeostasis protein
VELCDNPVEGGTTPSYGTIALARDKTSLAIYPIIRPRSGNYYYSDDEMEIIRRDIQMCRDLGCNGVSVGVQNIRGEIDTERLKRIVEWAGPLGVTCNRAFDGTPDPYEALEQLIACGCERVLTSGQLSAAPDAGEILGKLVNQAAGRIVVMPGAGINSYNLKQLVLQSNATEYHASARIKATNPLTFINTQVTDYGAVYIASEEEVKNLVLILNETSDSL